jgi:hypothetical protein
MALDAALGLPGARPGAVTSVTRPTNPFQGQVIVETDTNTVLFYTSSGWVSLGRDVIVGTEPTSPVEGQLWFDSLEGALYVYSSSSWELVIGDAIRSKVFSAKGDLIVYNQSSEAASVSVGTDNQVLVADSTTFDGIRWSSDISAVNVTASGSVKIPSNAPTSSVGASGDTAGMVTWDATYLYVCTADYDGSTSVWKRLTLETW